MAREARVNERIRAKEIRVIGPKGEQFGILTVEQGLKLARESSLDLVEVAPQAAPPVCRIINYGKFKYDQTKKAKEARKKQKVVAIKEVRMRPKIEEHDYQVKLRSARKFLGRGDKVKATLRFRGREIVHFDLGQRIMNRLIKDVEDIAAVEKAPFRERKLLIVVIAPK